MRIITTTESDETILASQLTFKHLIVAIKDGKPVILSKGFYEPESRLSFFAISYQFTKGNCYHLKSEYDTIEKMVIRAIELDYEVAAFHQKDWKQAFQWLIDNAE